MAKKSKSVTKLQRIDSLRKILARWGRLDKNQINSRLAAHLGIDQVVLARTIYRDLAELVNNNEVRVDYFAKDGMLIFEYDEEIHKNTFCEWSLIDNESQIVGQDILKGNGALLLASDRLNKYLKIDTGSNSIDTKDLNIFFNIPNHFLCLKISKEMLPITLVIGRIPSNVDSHQSLFKDIEAKFSKRTLLLSLPMASVSSFKVEDGQFGHAALSFESNSSSELGGVISLTDLKSKNKTYYCKLSQHDADQIKKNGIEMNQKTVTEVISKLNKSDSNFNKTQIIQNEKTQSPCLVFVSEQVPLLII